MKEKLNVERIERGWGSHFILAGRCLFRRNTLLTCGDIMIVVGSVGLCEKYGESRWDRIGFQTIGGDDRYFETQAYHAKEQDERFRDVDVGREVFFESPWAIYEIDADDRANEMHETVVAEITDRLAAGERFQTEEPESD